MLPPPGRCHPSPTSSATAARAPSSVLLHGVGLGPGDLRRCRRCSTVATSRVLVVERPGPSPGASPSAAGRRGRRSWSSTHVGGERLTRSPASAAGPPSRSRSAPSSHPGSAGRGRPRAARRPARRRPRRHGPLVGATTPSDGATPPRTVGSGPCIGRATWDALDPALGRAASALAGRPAPRRGRAVRRLGADGRPSSGGLRPLLARHHRRRPQRAGAATRPPLALDALAGVARVVELGGVGHLVQLDVPDAFAGLIGRRHDQLGGRHDPRRRHRALSPGPTTGASTAPRSPWSSPVGTTGWQRRADQSGRRPRRPRACARLAARPSTASAAPCSPSPTAGSAARSRRVPSAIRTDGRRDSTGSGAARSTTALRPRGRTPPARRRARPRGTRALPAARRQRPRLRVPPRPRRLLDAHRPTAATRPPVDGVHVRRHLRRRSARPTTSSPPSTRPSHPPRPRSRTLRRPEP